jgi:hypothetical protein
MTLAANLHTLPTGSDHHVTNCEVDIGSLWDAVRLVVGGRPDARVIEKGEFLERADPAARAEEPEIRVGSAIYGIASELKNDHQPGYGGETTVLTMLLKAETPVLVAAKRLSYMTYSDDSMDFSTGTTHDLYLLDEHDELAAGCFAILARRERTPLTDH